MGTIFLVFLNYVIKGSLYSIAPRVMSNRWYVFSTQVGANNKKPPRAEKEVGGVVSHSVGVEHMCVAMVWLWCVNDAPIETCSCILSSGASNFPFKLQCRVES